MGSGVSKHSQSKERSSSSRPSILKDLPCYCEDELEGLGLCTVDIEKLYMFFSRAVACTAGQNPSRAEVKRILARMGLENNALIRQAFNLVDLNDFECVSFRDMVLVLWIFCTIRDKLAWLVFEMFDTDNNGILDYKEYEKMTDILFGAKCSNYPDVIKLKDEILRQKKFGRTGVTKEFFANYCEEHTDLMAAVLLIQKQVQLALRLPSSSWRAWRARQKEIFSPHDGYLSFRKFNNNSKRGIYSFNPDGMVDVDQGSGSKVWESARPKLSQEGSVKCQLRRQSLNRHNSLNTIGSVGSSDSRRGSASSELGFSGNEVVKRMGSVQRRRSS